MPAPPLGSDPAIDSAVGSMLNRIPASFISARSRSRQPLPPDSVAWPLSYESVRSKSLLCPSRLARPMPNGRSSPCYGAADLPRCRKSTTPALATPVRYTTILKLLQIMHEKGLVRRDQKQRAHIYSPTQSREVRQRQLARDLLQRALNGSPHCFDARRPGCKEKPPGRSWPSCAAFLMNTKRRREKPGECWKSWFTRPARRRWATLWRTFLGRAH